MFVYEKIDGKTKFNIDGKHEKVRPKEDFRGDKGHFWNRFDTNLHNWTYDQPMIVGIILRLVFALLGSNRLDPYPSGNKAKVRNLWQDWPRPARWFMWHIRNFMQDFRKYYLGFASAFYTDRLHFAGYHIAKKSRPSSIWKELKIGFHMPKFTWLPFPVPFPIMEFRPWPDVLVPIRFVIGWKHRGLFSITLQRAD